MRMSCIEHDLSQVARIEAFPVGALKFNSPVFALVPTVSGLNTTDGKVVISCENKTVKLQEKTSVSVAGYVHEVSLEWETVTETEADYKSLVDLQQSPHEFVIYYFGGLRKVIRTDSSAYQFIFDDVDGKMKCRATLVNGQGLTLITN